MRKSRFTETQIVRISIGAGPREAEAVKNVCRGYGISKATFNKWKSKYGGMGASDIQRLKEIEEEKQRLKQM